MNLSKLFEIQRELDAHYQNVPDRLSKDILWLQTELGELANEWRGFRYRRPVEEQQPRTKEVATWKSESKVTESFGIPSISTFTIPETYRNPLLEEYTDCLSIILSIGNQLIHKGQNPHEIDKDKNGYKKHNTITGQFNLLFRIIGELWDYGELDEDYIEYIASFLDLGEMLDFTWEQIEANYIAKAEANKRRNVEV